MESSGNASLAAVFARARSCSIEALARSCSIEALASGKLSRTPLKDEVEKSGGAPELLYLGRVTSGERAD